MHPTHSETRHQAERADREDQIEPELIAAATSLGRYAEFTLPKLYLERNSRLTIIVAALDFLWTRSH